jgi:hypothetical protein
MMEHYVHLIQGCHDALRRQLNEDMLFSADH